ncbi:MAG: hypothetical protein Q9162_004462 [Coniocarpon cinnabarinum]
MPLRDLLKKKEGIDAASTAAQPQTLSPPVPEFKFVRTTTNDQELIDPPSFPGDDRPEQPTLSSNSKSSNKPRRLSNLLHRPKQPDSPGRSPSPSTPPLHPSLASPEKPKNERRRSRGISIGRKRSSTLPSEHVPENLPDAPLAITVTPEANGDSSALKEQQTQAEARWEERATLLAQAESGSRSRSVSTVGSERAGSTHASPHRGLDGASRPNHMRKVSDEQGDVDIQKAIRLHDEGQLEQATKMFRKLADPTGLNNALGQVLYGLALQHGWGCEENREEGLTYLSLAAKNSAAIESAALSAGARSGGAAKGELVLAIFEMAQCFRHGWGTAIDKNAARQYYETAANLGDTDAMSEAAWCYLEGFGGPKDKWKAAQYLRKAEEKGKKELGNTWIWKDKYNPGAKHKEK